MKTDGGMRPELALILAAAAPCNLSTPFSVSQRWSCWQQWPRWSSSGIAHSGDGSDYDYWLSEDFRQDFADDGAIKSHGCAGLLVSHLGIGTRRPSLTRVSRLDCSGRSHALVTVESARQKFQ